MQVSNERAAAGVDPSQVADELDIRNTLNRLNFLNDGGDLDEYVSCWTEDALREYPGGSWRGHAEIRSGTAALRESKSSGPGSNARHLVTNQVVRFDGPDTAVCVAYLMYMSDTSTRPVVRKFFRLEDTLRRTPSGWKVAHRKSTPG